MKKTKQELTYLYKIEQHSRLENNAMCCNENYMTNRNSYFYLDIIIIQNVGKRTFWWMIRKNRKYG